VLTGLLGTLSGAAFAHYVLFPGLVTFFASFDSPLMNFQPMVRDTFTQHKHMLLAMILVFQLPTIVLFLARLRLVTARLLWRHFKHAILIIFIAAALLTPTPDPWSQIVMAAPMLVMYLLSMDRLARRAAYSAGHCHPTPPAHRRCRCARSGTPPRISG
jgi:sec-independent protein translocase protein TatC